MKLSCNIKKSENTKQKVKSIMADFILEHTPFHFWPTITEIHCRANSLVVGITWLLPALPWKNNYKLKKLKVHFASKLRGIFKCVSLDSFPNVKKETTGICKSHTLVNIGDKFIFVIQRDWFGLMASAVTSAVNLVHVSCS